MKLIILFLAALSLFCSCSHVPYIILPEYQDLTIKNKHLLLVKIDSSDFSSALNVFDAKDNKKAYLSSYEKSLARIISTISTFSEVSIQGINNTKLRSKYVTLPDGQNVKLLTSPDKVIYTDDGHLMDYVLIISSIKLEGAWIEESFGPYAEGYRLEIDYVIWDNYKTRLVCYGKSLVSFTNLAFQNGYLTSAYYIGKNARFIIENSPFKK